jgi:polysaccharide pyruvyl transferase WcaK-like protein
MNIVFSTTRQWNPGDEFILMGCINLLHEHFGDFNPIIYNRNPQTRRARKYDIIKGIDKLAGKDFVEKFLDNSVKERPPLDYADLVVFAGSPEWRGRRMVKLYESILEFDIPSVFLGIGTSGPFAFNDTHFTSAEQEVFKRARLITTRDSTTQHGLQPLETHQLPCPALLSSRDERTVKSVKRIGLMYGTDSAVASNNVSSKTYRYMMEMYRQILDEFGSEVEIEFVSHYIDELSPFRRDFPGQALRYSYDAKDYLDIYGRYDLVIGYRVHGIGISASMGIPGIMISHDPRAATVKGFKSEMVDVGTPYSQLRENIQGAMQDIESKSRALQAHKTKTRAEYLTLIEASVER